MRGTDTIRTLSFRGWLSSSVSWRRSDFYQRPDAALSRTNSLVYCVPGRLSGIAMEAIDVGQEGG